MSRLDERPWFKFRPDRWLGSSDLQSCSLAAQGLWANLICIMHGAPVYGHLMTKRGRPMTAHDIAKELPRISVEQIEALIAELGAEEVFDRRDDGCIFSRRMVRDYAKAMAGKSAKEAALSEQSGDLFSEPENTENDLEGALEGQLEGALEGHKNKKERDMEKKNLPLNPPQEGESFAARAAKAKPEKQSEPKAKKARASKPSPSKPKATRSVRRVCTLPADWAPEADHAELASAELRMTAAEFADSVASFREWAGSNGRKLREGSEPNWNLAFRNHLRRDAATLRSRYRRDMPAPYGAAPSAAPSSRAADAPQWWSEIRAKFEADEFFASEWPEVWSRVTPVSQSPCVVRTLSPATWAAINRNASAYDRFEAVCGFPITVLPPEKAPAR